MDTNISQFVLENKEDRSLKRAISYVVFFFIAILGFWGWNLLGGEGSPMVYGVTEILSQLIALIAGSTAITLYYSSRHNHYLLMVGAAMIGAAIVDALIFLLSPEMTFWYLSGAGLYMATVLLVALGLVSHAEYNEKEKQFPDVLFLVICGVLAVVMAISYLLVPIDLTFEVLGVYMLRVSNVIAGMFFVLGGAIFVARDSWRFYVFDNWVVYLFMFYALSNLMFMPLSVEIYDGYFTAAHFLKALGNMAIMIGVLSSLRFLFHSSELWRKNLEKSNESLIKFKNDSDSALQALNSEKSDIEAELNDLEGIKKATINILEDLHDEKVKLAESKAKDEAVLNSIGDGLVVTDEAMNVMLINSQTAKMLGWQSDEMIGRNWLDFVLPADEKSRKLIEREKLPIYKALKETKRSQQNNLLYQRKDESRLPVSVTCSPIVSDSQLVGAVIVFRDITHEKEVDRSKTEFVSLASHQLRTPLSAINWYAEMLIAGDAGNISDEQKSYVEEIYQSNQRMVELVDSLLNVSRIDLGTFAVDPEPTDVVKVCQSVVEELMPQVNEKKIEMDQKYDDKLVEINTDPKLMRIIFQNLLSNAVKYTPNEGKVSVDVQGKGEYFTVIVADTGYGIPKKQHEKIFSKLFRADNVMEKETDGTGLGLYLVKAIIDEAGGDIRFESEENKGTTFFVKLPMSGMKKKIGTKGLS